MIAAARRRTGGGVEEVAELTDIENRIVSIMGGPSFATGDRHLEINPFNETDATEAGSTEHSDSILQNCELQGADLPVLPAQKETEVYELQWNQSAIAVLGDESERTSTPGPIQRQAVADTEIHPTPGPSRLSHEGMGILGERVAAPPSEPEPAEHEQESNRLTPTRRLQSVSATSRRVLQPSPRAGARRRRQQTQHSPGAGSSAARRRLLRRSPPSQRRSEMASLTERFIAIEERRAEAEVITARAQEMCAQGQQTLAASVAQLAHSWAAHAQAINALVEAITRNRE